MCSAASVKTAFCLLDYGISDCAFWDVKGTVSERTLCSSCISDRHVYCNSQSKLYRVTSSSELSSLSLNVTYSAGYQKSGLKNIPGIWKDYWKLDLGRPRKSNRIAMAHWHGSTGYIAGFINLRYAKVGAKSLPSNPFWSHVQCNEEWTETGFPRGILGTPASNLQLIRKNN